MGNILKLAILLLILIFLNRCSGDSKDGDQWSKLITHKSRGVAPPIQKRDINIADCEDFVVLKSASQIGREIERPREWVKQNFTIPLFADTTLDKPRIVGQAPPGGHCFIVKREGRWYYVQSPLESKLGWLNRDYVVGFVKKDPVTFIPC